MESILKSSNADVIVPCDDRAADTLRTVHRETGDRQIKDVIERSLGDPTGYAVLNSRHDVLELVHALGVRTANSAQIESAADLQVWESRHAYPGVLKADGSWGGTGVRIVHSSAEAVAAFKKLRSRNLKGAVKRMLFNRDAYPVGQYKTKARPSVSMQEYVKGHPANCMAACWRGELLAIVSVESMRAQSETGAATIVHVIDNAEMRATAQAVIRRLNLSGYCGFDFMIEEKTEAAYLIEINPRATQLGHLALGPGRNLAAALYAAVTGTKTQDETSVTDKDVIALFPQAWEWTPDEDLLREAFHDIPEEDGELYRELSLDSWPNRGLLARLDIRLRNGHFPAKISR